MDDAGTTRKFKYTENVATYLDYCRAVGFHNVKRHDGRTKHGLSIEET